MSEASTTVIVCPKCAGPMRNYERSGVVIDQCQECRGVYLDRGELERLISAEEQAYGEPPRSTAYRERDDNYDNGGHGSKHGSSKHGSSSNGYKKRRGGFLGELFD